MFTNLPKQGEQSQFKSGQNKKHFFDALPSSFKRNEAIELAEKFKIKSRSADSFLKSCLGKYLQQSSFGVYVKI